MRIPTITDEMAEKVLEAAASPVVLEVTALGPDQARSRRILEIIADEFMDRIIFLRIFQEENPEYVRRLFVKAYPTIIIFRRRAETFRLQGVMGTDQIRSRLEIEADKGRA